MSTFFQINKAGTQTRQILWIHIASDWPAMLACPNLEMPGNSTFSSSVPVLAECSNVDVALAWKEIWNLMSAERKHTTQYLQTLSFQRRSLALAGWDCHRMREKPHSLVPQAMLAWVIHV